MRVDQSEVKWIKIRRDRVEQSDQVGKDRGGTIRVDQIKKNGAEH